MIIKHRIVNEEYLGQSIYSRPMTLFDDNGPYQIQARAHRLYRGMPAKHPSKGPIKIFKKTNAFWVYDTEQGQRQLLEVN